MSTSELRIGVTMRVLEALGYHETRDALAQNWSEFLKTALPGAAWMPLPNLGAVSIRSYCEKWGINGLILTGGEDFGVIPLRDETERDLLAWAKGRKMPALGICRGMQMMAMQAGSTLKLIDGHVRTRHVLCGSFSHEVNSFHNYGLLECPQGFVVTARSEDGNIEAICNPELHWEGWMWHPEREMPFNPVDIERLRTLFA